MRTRCGRSRPCQRRGKFIDGSEFCHAPPRLLKETMSDQSPRNESWHGTTIIMVRKGGQTVIGGDGQVTIGQTIIKGNAKKVRRLAKGEVIGGFAGATADAFTLFERLEAKLEQ